METSIGVFASRDRAEEAIKELIEKKVPENEIVFLTSSENDATSLAKELGAYAGGFLGGTVGLSAAVVAATLLVIPGIGPVFALGAGASALMGYLGASAGSKVGKAATQGDTTAPTASIGASEDIALFAEALKRGRSLVVVRTESRETCKVASGILDRIGMSIQGSGLNKLRHSTRQVQDVIIIDCAGRITVGEGNIQLREAIQGLIGQGKQKLILNLVELEFIDSAGIGELVRAHTTLRKQGGHLKLLNPHKKVHDLLRATMLTAVFDIHTDEGTAVKSFEGARATGA
ncbi:MAG TPA: STAS domain-containing protein [Candidatus Binatus sp.]|nr:STAS domain-containing protein [Candidatus Binatus sp.]